jgi:hypothetical protein
MDINDTFEEAALLEESYARDGWADGAAHGATQGHAEGYSAGAARGFEVGEEAGFYRGVLSILISPPVYLSLPRRVQRAVCDIRDDLDSLPLHDPHDDSLLDSLAYVRSRFKPLAASLGVARALSVVDPSASATLASSEIGNNGSTFSF